MIAYVFQKEPEKFTFQLFIIFQYFTREICYFLKKLLEKWLNQVYLQVRF